MDQAVQEEEREEVSVWAASRWHRCVGVRGRSGHWSGWLPREGAFGPA